MFSRSRGLHVLGVFDSRLPVPETPLLRGDLIGRMIEPAITILLVCTVFRSLMASLLMSMVRLDTLNAWHLHETFKWAEVRLLIIIMDTSSI
jgi:hypothetical protein